MAGTSKTKWAQLKVGIMAVVAFAIVAWLIFLMSATQGFFTAKTYLYTYLNDSEAVAEASQVTLNGINVGQVSKVEFSGSSQPNRIVKITMAINSSYLSSIPADSQAELVAANLLGTKYINIKKGKSAQAVQSGGEIASSVSAELEDVFRQSSETLGALQTTVNKLSDIIDQVQVGKGTIGKLFVDPSLYDHLNQISTQIDNLITDLHTTLDSTDNSIGKFAHDNGEIYGDVHGIATQVSGVMTKVDALVDGINTGKGTLGQLAQNPAAYDDTRQILADVHKLLAGIDAGQGTAGKLLKTDEFGDQIKSTMGRVDSLLDKMNNGNGTVARLLNDSSLSDDLDSMMRESQGLLKDFRANPKKFLRIELKLF